MKYASATRLVDARKIEGSRKAGEELIAAAREVVRVAGDPSTIPLQLAIAIHALESLVGRPEN